MIDDAGMNWDETRKSIVQQSSLSWEINEFLFLLSPESWPAEEREINSIFYFSQGHTTSSDFFVERIEQVSSTFVPHVTCFVSVLVEPFASRVNEETSNDQHPRGLITYSNTRMMLIAANDK